MLSASLNKTFPSFLLSQEPSVVPVLLCPADATLQTDMAIQFHWGGGGGGGVNVLIQLLQHTPVMGTDSSYHLGCLSRTEG